MLGLRLLRSTFVGSRAIRVELRHTVFVETLIEASVAAGSKDDGLTMAQELLDEALLNDGRCCVPEMLRLRGELALYRGVPAPADLAAEKDFAEALDIAGRQGAHMWRLRAATSLARLLQRRGERSEARNLLLPIHERFTEGFATADLRAARALINHLQ